MAARPVIGLLRGALGGLTALWPAGLAWAQEQAPSALPESGFGAALFQMVAGLAAVLGLMIGLYWLLRRFTPGRTASGGGGLRLLGRLALGPRKFVGLVQVAGRVLVLGVSDRNISLLCSIEDPEQVRSLSQGGLMSFGRAFKRAAEEEGEGA